MVEELLLIYLKLDEGHASLSYIDNVKLQITKNNFKSTVPKQK
jgi:hypothetical protein